MRPNLRQRPDQGQTFFGAGERRAGQQSTPVLTPERELRKACLSPGALDRMRPARLTVALLMLAGRNDEEERELVDSALDGLESGEGLRQMLDLADAWARSDQPRLEDCPRWCRCLETPFERDQWRRLQDECNSGMARRIAALQEGGQRVSVGVGALHMIGPTGLPALLRERGFQVTRVVPPP